MREVDGKDPDNADKRADLKKVSDFVGGLKLDLEAAESKIKDATKEKKNFEDEARRLLKGGRLDLSKENAKQKHVPETDWDAAQTARQLAKEVTSTIQDAKQEVEKLKGRIAQYESELERLEKETAEPGELEKALEAFLQKINVRAPPRLRSC